MDISKDIKEHEKFTKYTEEFISECLKNGSDEDTILGFYKEFIHTVEDDIAGKIYNK